MVVGTADAVRYTAFLSYSHKDAVAAGRLHRRLETYRMPKRLVGTETARGSVPQRLAPIFRDRDELPAATDLSETVRAALAESEALIILCSPAAASSFWVAEEIRTFRTMHPDRPILAAIIDGEPSECFPESLRPTGPEGARVEPLATDLRKQGDGMHLGLLKLVAGITGVPLDALVQRDAARHVRRVMSVSMVAVIAMLMMAALTLFALDARREAELQRAEAERQRDAAEGQIEFMLTELRTRLKGVGRLEIMAAVNRHAIAYYNNQDLAMLSPDSLEQRARVLHAIGEDELERENPAGALAAFRQAHRTTAEQLDRAPQDPDRIFAHSQSEFYVGNVAYERGDYITARRAFEQYKSLADRLVAINSANAAWLKEAAYAEGSICTVLWKGVRDIKGALGSCAAALQRMKEAARISGRISDFRSDLANRHADLADTLLAAGRPADALIHQLRRLDYLDRQLVDDPQNARLAVRRVWALRGLAYAEAQLGQTAKAITHMDLAIRRLEGLVRQDPDNADWRKELTVMRSESVHLSKPRKP